MERLINQSHNKTAFVYAGSRLFERAGYYGLRAILVLYMISESIKMSEIEALKLYGTFTASVMLSQIVGALFGDLILGNRKAVIIGGALQAFGAFFFCIPSAMGMYIGLFLVALGDGLYTPNH
jgi:POT family proton-dependent oligopeptide transporter